MQVRELRVSYHPSVNGPPLPDQPMSKPCESAAFFMPLLAHEAVEVFVILCLSIRHYPLAYYVVARGSLCSTIVEPREVFKAAVLSNAAYIIAGHNHPSGDPEPSADDTALTRRLKAAGTLLGIELLDHVIVGHNRYFSFKEAGQI